MKQKLLDKILYVFDVTPYEITEDGDAADVIKVQSETYEGFVALNPDLADKIVKYNYHMLTVNRLEWADYVDEPDPEPETQNSISGTDLDENTGLYGTLTVSLEDELPLVVEYEEGNDYSPFEAANALYLSYGDLTDSSKYSWTKDGDPIEGVEATGGDTEPLVYTYDNDGEDGPMFTVDEDENGTTATITPDATGVFEATLVPPEPEEEPTECTVTLTGTGANANDINVEVGGSLITDFTDYIVDPEAGTPVFTMNANEEIKIYPLHNQEDYLVTCTDADINVDDSDQYYWYVAIPNDTTITVDYTDPNAM